MRYARPKQMEKWWMHMHFVIKRAHHHTLLRAVSVKCREYTYQLSGYALLSGCEHMWERDVRSRGTRTHIDAFVLVSYHSERTVHCLSELHFFLVHTTIAAACTQTIQVL